MGGGGGGNTNFIILMLSGEGGTCLLINRSSSDCRHSFIPRSLIWHVSGILVMQWSTTPRPWVYLGFWSHICNE